VQDQAAAGVFGIGVRIVIHETGMNPRVTALACIVQLRRMEGGTGIRLGEDVVARMAVGATGDPLWVTEMEHLPVIGFIVAAHGLCREFVPFRHFGIGMAGTAAPGIGLPGHGDIPG